MVVLALLKVAFLGKGVIRDWVHGMGLSPVCYIPYCRFYTRYLSRHLLLPAPGSSRCCLSLEHNEPHRLSNQKNFVYLAEIGD